MPEVCICIQCGKEFKVKPYKKDTAKFCSKECLNKNKKGNLRGEWITKTCPSCGKEFVSLKSKGKKYCSEKCNHERNENYMIYKCDVCEKEIRIKKNIYQDLLDGKRKSITCSRECASIIKHTGRDIICENCGKKFYRRQYHIELHEHHFCSNACQLEYQHKEKFEIRKCEICGKEFECSKLSTQRFCSNKCNSEWQKTLLQEENSNFKSIKVSCTYCGKEHFVKPSRFSVQEHFFCSKECRQDWYSNIYSKTEEWRNKKRLDAIKILESGLISRTNSKPQQIVDNILIKNNIIYEREKGLEYYCVDNFLTALNLIIEVQGDYWHSNPIKFSNKINKTQYERIQKDKRKHTYIKNKYDIEILYLWESDIYEDIDKCEKLILEYIKMNGKLKNYHSFNYHINLNKELKLCKNIIIPYQDMECAEYTHLLKVS